MLPALTLVCLALWAVGFALREAILVPTYHVDGAFQAASGLFRLSAGQLPGSDFFPYLGAGLVYALAPAFVAFGGDLTASVAAVHLMMIVCGVIVAATLVRFVVQPRGAWFTGAAAFVLPAAFLFETKWVSTPAWFGWMIWPGNSLRPLRAVLPYVVALCVHAVWWRVRDTWRRYAILGVVTGAALTWSNDYAVPTALVTVLAIAIGAVRRREWAPFALYCLATPLAAVAMLSLVTGGHAGELVRFNAGLAHDQWWYFAHYGEARRVLRFRDVTKLLSVMHAWPLIVLALSAAVAWKWRRREHVAVFAIGLVTLGGGLVASLGGHLDNGYFGGFRAWAGMVLVAVALRLVSSWLRERSKYAWPVLLACAVAAAVVSKSRHDHRVEDAATDASLAYVPELGGYLDKEWEPYVTLARDNANRTVVEEYFGLWSAITRRFSPWPVDASIHALGSMRERAASAITSADLIITTRPEATEVWYSWGVSQNHWLYGPLINGWEIVASSPKTHVWQRSAEGTRPSAEVVPCAGDGDALRADTTAPGYFEIELGYEVSNTERALVLVQNNMSFGSDANGHVSVDPSAQRAVFFASVTPGTPLRFWTMPRQKVRVTSCRAFRVAFFDPRAQPVTDVASATDENWVRGVAKKFSGFRVTNTEANRDSFRTGRIVRFANGELRAITGATPSGKFIHVRVEGARLDPSAVGPPSELTTLAR